MEMNELLVMARTAVFLQIVTRTVAIDCEESTDLKAENQKQISTSGNQTEKRR